MAPASKQSSSSNAAASSSSDLFHPPSLSDFDPVASSLALSRLQQQQQQQSASSSTPTATTSMAAVDGGLAASSPTPDFSALLAQALAADANGGSVFEAGSGSIPPAFVNANQLSMAPMRDTPTDQGKGEGSSTAAGRGRSTSPNHDQATAGPSAPTPSHRVPPFLNKLRSMVDDSGTDSLICWQPDGKTFIVPNHVRFAKEVLPRFFKHNNFPSFVRQLNMYGFHKVPSLQQGSLKHEQEMEIWEFEEKNFQRDRPDLMGFMQRKKGTKAGDDKEKSGAAAAGGDDDEDKNKALVDNKVSEGLTSVSGALTRAGESESLMQLTNVWQAIQAIQNAQTSINDNLRHLSLSNDELWKETMEQKRRSEQQAETINRMLRFLAGVYAGHDGLVNGDGGTPSKGRNRRGAGGAGGDASGRADSTPSSPLGSLFRNSSSGGPLLIEGAKLADDVSGDDNEETNSAQIHELFSRFSEATNSPEANGNGNSNSGANIFDANSPSARFSTIPSPRGGRSRSSSPSQLIPSSPQPPSSATPRRPALLGDTPRRATTPGPAKAGRSTGLSGQQILQALSSGEGQALLQQLMGGSNAGGGGSGGGGIDPAKQLDPNMLAALFAAFQGANANSSGSQSNAGPSTPGPSSNFQNWTKDNDDDSSRFTYPSINTADPSSSSSSALARLPAWQQHQLTAQHGVLQQTEQSAGLLQHAIEQLAGSVPRPPTSGSGPDSAFSAAGSHAPIAGPAPAPAVPTPGDWSQFAGGAVDPTASAAAGTPGLSNDLDMDDLLASFINTGSTPGNGSGGGGIEELLPTPTNGSNAGSGQATPTAASGVEETGKVTTRAGRKRKDLEEGEDSSSPATASKARFGTNTRVEDAE